MSLHPEASPTCPTLSEPHPGRGIDAGWGAKNIGAFSGDMVVVASDRQGLLRDVGEALAREKINVTAVNTQSKQDLAYMRFTCDVADGEPLRRALSLVKDAPGVPRASRG